MLVLGLPYRVLNVSHKKELLRGLWVHTSAPSCTSSLPTRAGTLSSPVAAPVPHVGRSCKKTVDADTSADKRCDRKKKDPF